MIIIDNILISNEIIESHFQCNLAACKGACCWEGDFGAPLTDEEIQILKTEYTKLEAYLPEDSRQLIATNHFYKDYPEKI